MPRGYRCIVIAIVGWISASACAQAQQQQTKSGKPAAAHEADKPKDDRVDLAGLPRQVERAIRNPNPRNETERVNRDLAAQEASAMWGFWIVAVSLLQAIVSVIGIYFIIQTLRQGRMSIRTAFAGLRQTTRQSRAAEKAVAETQRIGEAQVRCYLTGVSAQIGFTADGTVMIDCTISNSGQSPAKCVSYSSNLVYSCGDEFRLFDKEVSDHPTFEVDIGAQGEEDISDCRVAQYSELVAIPGKKILFTLEVTITALDVFKLPVLETERFSTFLDNLPPVNTWFDLKRAARVVKTAG